MCTVVVSFEPASSLPLVVLAVRDELLGRPWVPPGFRWPQHPGLLGGMDLVAGGTWLAVNPETHTAGFVLNGAGRPAELTGRRSRGDLPLRAAAGEPLPADLVPFDPFHLIKADPSGAAMSSWDGERFSELKLPAGTSVIVNTGLDPQEPRAGRLIPLLAQAKRPEPRPGDGPEKAWGQWLELASGLDMAREDSRALILRGETEEHVAHGSSSVTLLAMSWTYLRYDFAPVPDEPGPLVVTQVV